MTLRVGHEKSPPCFGKDDEYSETSPHCKACPFQSACCDKIQASINSYVQPYTRTRTVRKAPQVSYNSRNRNTTNSRWQQSTPAPNSTAVRNEKGNMLIRPAKFNHNKPLGTQYVHYVMYDTAESMATRAVELIRSCREEYERSLHERED